MRVRYTYTMSENETIILTGPDQTKAFQLLRVRSALKIECVTTMRMSRGSIMNLAAEYCGSKKRTKRGVYADYNAYLVGLGFEDKPLP